MASIMINVPNGSAITNVVHTAGASVSRCSDNILEHLKFCKHQSRYFLKKSGELLEYLNDLHRLHDESVPRGALTEVARVLKKGCLLIESCASPEWVWVAVLREENKTGFQDLFQDLSKSIEYLRSSQNESLEDESATTFKWEWEEELSCSAIQDRKELAAMIKSSWRSRMIHSLILRGKYKSLRSFLFEELSSPPTDDRDQIILPDQHIYLFLNPQHIESKKLIGGGAYGRVFDAKWLGKPVAVKEYSSHDKSFMREVSALMFLRHPNIVRMVGYSRNTKIAPYSLIMERMQRDLHHLIMEIVKENSGCPPFPLEVSLDILWQISKGMDYLHQQNVFHRDLKTANILVNLPSPGSGEFYTCKISDFGLAKTKFLSAASVKKRLPKQVLQVSQPAGTVIYMAPEVWHKGNNNLNPKKADVYSFAMTCYEVLTGKVPFEDEGFTSIDAFFKMVFDENIRPKLPEEFPECLISLLNCCWDGNVSLRPSFAQISNYLCYLKNNLPLPPHVSSPRMAANSQDFGRILEAGALSSPSFSRDHHETAIEALEMLKIEIQESRQNVNGARGDEFLSGLANYEIEVERSIECLQRSYASMS